MDLLKEGSHGPSTAYLQKALNRAGFGPLACDGFFGPATGSALIRFQLSRGIIADGIAGGLTHAALMPWYTGCIKHKILPGDTLFKLSQQYGSSITAIQTANPGINALNLQPGAIIMLPLPFPVVLTDISYCSELIRLTINGLRARFPFIRLIEVGKSVMDKPILGILLGKGENRVIYAGSFHSNEWITTPLLLKFTEELCTAYSESGEIFGQKAREIFEYSSLLIIPAVNPDGIDVNCGELQKGEYYKKVRTIAARYPRYAFPSGWKANIAGTDLNLQFPAGWEQARDNKFAAGIVSPAPGDYVGTAALSAPESRAIYDITLNFDPHLILAYHTQGRVIYWKYRDMEPYNSKYIADIFSSVSGYGYTDTPFVSGFAGWKDWFIQDFNRPGYTIECGIGKNPLPISDFPTIYENNLGILTLGALLT